VEEAVNEWSHKRLGCIRQGARENAAAAVEESRTGILRSFEGSGAHQRLKFRVHLSEELVDGRGLTIVQPLPAVAFIDPYEKNLVGGVDSTRVAVDYGDGSIDVESIEAKGAPPLVLFILVNQTYCRTAGCEFDIQLHFRYPLVRETCLNFVSNPIKWLRSEVVDIVLPSLSLLGYSSANKGCVEALVEQEYLPPTTVVPAGSMRHRGFVNVCTVTSLLSTCLMILFAIVT